MLSTRSLRRPSARKVRPYSTAAKLLLPAAMAFPIASGIVSLIGRAAAVTADSGVFPNASSLSKARRLPIRLPGGSASGDSGRAGWRSRFEREESSDSGAAIRLPEGARAHRQVRHPKPAREAAEARERSASLRCRPERRLHQQLLRTELQDVDGEGLGPLPEARMRRSASTELELSSIHGGTGLRFAGSHPDRLRLRRRQVHRPSQSATLKRGRASSYRSASKTQSKLASND